MKLLIFIVIYAFLVFQTTACAQPGQNVAQDNEPAMPVRDLTDTAGRTIATRFNPPEGFVRTEEPATSFSAWLRDLPLKPDGSEVRLFDGRIKRNDGIYDAVVNLEIGNRNLHQCADAIIRLRAEFLYSQGKYDSIAFNFTNGFRADYSDWRSGKRIRVEGNHAQWIMGRAPSGSYVDFRKYLETVFTYAGTWSLSRELKSIRTEEMRPGDVFIRGGSPGHAIIVVDMAENRSTGQRLFMLAQSYMPAQEIQILKNPLNKAISPWYTIDFGNTLITPEWTFNRQEIKRF